MNSKSKKKLKKICKNLIFEDDIFSSEKCSQVSFPIKIHNLLFDIEEKSFWFRFRNNLIIQVIKKFAPGGEIFDIGGGNGSVSLAIQENGYEVFLIEPDKEAIYNAKKRGVKNLICSCFENLNIKRNSISAIGLFDVLEHIRNDKDFLSRLKLILKKNGKIYLTVPAFNFLWSAEDNFAGHFRRYSIKTISRILKEADFKIEYSTYFFSFLFLPILFGRTMPYMLNKKKKCLIGFHKKLIARQKFIEKIFQMLARFETFLIKRKIRIPLGSSCLIVASAK